MKRLIISMLFVLLFTSFCIVPAYAQLPNLSLYHAAEKTQYRLKLEAGKEYYMQTITEQQISDPTPANEGTTVMTVGTGAQLEVSDIDANGNAQVTYTYKWIKIGIKGATVENIYDSSKKDSTVPKELQWFAPLLEESFLLTITPEGRISEIKDLDKVRSNVRQKLPQGPMQELAMNSLNQWLDEQTIRESIENSFAIYPDRPVGVGDSWSRNVTYSSGSAMILESKWTLKERKNGVAVIEVASTIKPNSEAKPVEMGSPGITSSSEFTGNQQGLIEMQESTGLIIRSKINQQMSGQNTITRPGVPDNVTPMEITGVISMETSDWEKARSNIGTNVVAQEQPRREAPSTRPDSIQRRANISAGAATSPYLIDGEDRMMPAARPRSERQKSTSIHDAARNGDVNHAQQLISKGADVNTRNRMNWTPLHTAVTNRKQAFVELLISKGADLNAKDNRGQTPLHVAVNTYQKEVVELLIAKGADVNIMAGSNNALTLAKRRNNTEIVDILVKNGAKEPSPQDLMGDRYYGGGANPYSSYQEQSTTQPGTIRRGGRTGRTINQAPAAVDILADPNEIKARVKTFAGLEKVLEEVANKSQNEMRQWPQRRYDNRTMLVRAVQKQFEDEINLIRTVSVSEKAKKTTEAIDSVLTTRQERIKNISRELMAQKRQLRQTQQQTTRTRGRGRTSSRSMRGQTSQGGQQYEQYGGNATEQAYGRGNVMPRTNRYPGTTRGPSQQTTQPIDREAENETRQWLQASFDNKSDLASAVHEQIRLEVTSIRDLAVEEAAKKTTATIDGLLLARKMRLDAFIIKMEEQQQALRQQTQDPRMGGRYMQTGPSRGQTTRGGTTGGYQQDSQSRTRRRR
ncbi:MAG: ankyrin repeat domain-containing protein [Planctomycetes bacterium]|nr:ankyrin repeat domain-containing protein [Planctomycetota bacterium]